MNCPNCGGLLNLKERKCEYCNTTFTEAELELNKAKAQKENTKSTETPEPQRKKSLTEQKQEELQKERKNRKTSATDTDSTDIVTGAAVMGILGLFSGVRSFFYNLKRTTCLILLIALEVAFAFFMISSKVTELLKGELQGFVAVNIIIIANALLAGIISRIGRVRAGTAITAVINFLAVVWVFVFPMITTDFAGQSPQSVAVFAVIEMAVLALSVVLSHLIYKRQY